MVKPDFIAKKPDFLIKMYETYNKEIDRHFAFAWQAVSVFAASIVAILTATETITGVPAYIALSLYVVLVSWGIDTIIDSYFWYNRNLVVIANIERQFLDARDATEIHYYFLTHRPVNKPITFFLNLLVFLVTMPMLVILFYFWIPASLGKYDFYRNVPSYIPLIVLAIAVLSVRASAHKRNVHYKDFLRESPGVDRGFGPKTPEHSFKEPLGLSSVSRLIEKVQDALLRIIGIETK